MGEIKDFKPYEVVEFDWGTAVRHRNGKWEKLFISPDGQEIDVTNIEVILHGNGIEFI
ncbi:hypothetical protein [Sediminibacillus massiliensis]|uniref:hypothetical protein n=1 Tax=Sediminibacillus massiliensis TaxID=1926277 RepID=UPI0015C35181|nr:hypothetical protein [Sediminibacillus massiliensis]